MRDKIYYLVMHRGMPVDVTMYEFNATERAKERSIPGHPATVLAVSPVQLDLFPEEDTTPDCLHAEPHRGCFRCQ